MGTYRTVHSPEQARPLNIFPHMIRLHGKIIPGLGLATEYLAMQLPLIAKEFPEVANCHRGSINLRLDRPLRIATPDFTTSEIDWGEQQEIFDFTRITIEPLKRPAGRNPKYRAWIYGPRNSSHRADPFHIEVILKEKINLKGVRGILVRIDRKVRRVSLTIF